MIDSTKPQMFSSPLVYTVTDFHFYVNSILRYVIYYWWVSVSKQDALVHAEPTNALPIEMKKNKNKKQKQTVQKGEQEWTNKWNQWTLFADLFSSLAPGQPQLPQVL